MRIKPVLYSSMFLAVLLILVPHNRIVSATGFDWSTVAVENAAEDQRSETVADEANVSPKKSGNSFVRTIGAPFRAFARLFGGGKKNDQQARGSSNKDRAKFESTKVIRIKDARTPVETPAESTPPVSETAVDTNLQRGRELLSAGDLNGAIAELSLAASGDSKSAEANNLLGIAYEGKGLRDRALEAFKAAVQADKKNAEYLNNYGFLLFKNSDLEDATKYLKRAAKLAPDNPRIWNNLGLAQCRRGKFDDAFESFTHAVGEFNGHLNIASQLLAHGYAKDAIKHLEIAQKMQPNSTEVLAKLVQLYETTGRVSDAETARRSIIALQTSADVKK
jgi:Flp pilus assembly protein TadD